jgi:predicted lipoprotein with Yx(FWY)xxD motif
MSGETLAAFPSALGGIPMTSFRKLMAASIAVALLVGACGSSAGTQAPAGASGTPGSGSATTVTVKSIGGANILVDGSSGMTLYVFATDVANSGKSACNSGCAPTWPPMTVTSGTTPSAGSGASGALATITRDDGTIQVTYNGLPLHHYSGDRAPGDTTGNYPGWSTAKA